VIDVVVIVVSDWVAASTLVACIIVTGCVAAAEG